MTKENFNSQIHSALANNDESKALSLYAAWYKLFDTPQKVLQQWHPQHRKMAASLSRKAFYYSVNVYCEGLPRCKHALDGFIGLEQVIFEHEHQKPSFFYFPGLSAKPFYHVGEINGLSRLIDNIQCGLDNIGIIGTVSRKSYIDHIGSAPKSEEWQRLSSDWQSQHFMSGGKATALMGKMPLDFKDAFYQPIIAQCPPFSPEVFVSTLLPGAYIPEHYGISNVKLTVHVPLNVSKKAWLKVGSEKFQWCSSVKAMIFDDSFIHSAKNESSVARDVLIFDVWHPQLKQQEKAFIQKFMQIHDNWKSEYGYMVGLDRGLYSNA